MFGAVKKLVFKVLSFTALDPLDREFPRLPPGKYGDYVCQICKEHRAERWHEQTRVMFCSVCALKSKGWI